METEARPPTSPRPPSSPPPLPAAAAVDPSSPADRPLDADIASPALTGHGGLQEAVESSTDDALPDAEIFFDALEDQGPQEGMAARSDPAFLTNELRDKIVRQVEYYFSDENLPTDKFLLKFVKRDKEGFVPIAIIASFRRMKKLVQDLSLIEAALRTSSQLVVSVDGKKVKRLHPLPVTEIKDTKPCTVLVENLPENYSKDSIQRLFGNIGNILNITIHDPHSKEESATARKAEIAISSKVHALVEYETVEAAERAVATLNDEKNWRTGMRVELLLKRMEKYGLVQQGHRGTFSEKNNDIQTAEMAGNGKKMKSVDYHDEMAEKVEEQSAIVKGGRRSRYKNRGKDHSQRNDDGHGPGSVAAGSGCEYMSKPVPGPRMPDGTRGFTMGRGKPIVSDHECT
ncbi:la-related protein 6A [Phoenix dactylifera]|uniref:La-related protein 6A n=1 Tax=Phoenix dactylifera TaxID=42345 RepID=A0A8B7C221_PHODC|nr:la-related protein 6A [Phoenix dactylifera]